MTRRLRWKSEDELTRPDENRSRFNLELKVQLDSIANARVALKSIGAEYVETVIQTDTYFKCESGRLKLRESPDRPPEIIAYERPTSPGLRVSEYVIRREPEAQTDRVEEILDDHEIDVIVHKTRELHRLGNTRVHLDSVTDLGKFLEFEAVAATRREAEAESEKLAWMASGLGIDLDRSIPGSYSELMRAEGLSPLTKAT